MQKNMEIKSNEGIIRAFLGWEGCSQEIQAYQSCKKTGGIMAQEPTKCYSLAKTLQQCYADKCGKIQGLCVPIYNDTKQCLFQSDSHIINCKQELNEFVYCNKNPKQYLQFLKISSPIQKQSKFYDYFMYSSKYDGN